MQNSTHWTPSVQIRNTGTGVGNVLASIIEKRFKSMGMAQRNIYPPIFRYVNRISHSANEDVDMLQ